MRIRTLVLLCTVTLYTSIATLCLLQNTFAQVMQSGSYQIQADSVNFAGGFSSSTSYRLESTAGEIATGNASSTSYNLYAGYQQMLEVYLSLSGATDVVMTPTIPGVTGGTANGSTTLTVITDSSAGYSLAVESTNSPSMQSLSSSIDDYVPTGNPDFSFITGVGDAVFGFSPEGGDVAQRYLDNGSLCNLGSGNTPNACWDGLSTTPVEIARATNSNHPLGATTTIQFRVGIGAGVGQAPGIYTATTTVTALPL